MHAYRLERIRRPRTEARRSGAVVGCALAAALSTSWAAAAHADAPRDATERLFARWARSDSPGCAAGVARDGKTLLLKAWGQADLERPAPLDAAASVLDAAAWMPAVARRAVELLVADGKLKLDDRLRRWLPELPAWAEPLTLRHLVEHRSGIRDYRALHLLMGVTPEDVVTNEDLLGLLARQRHLGARTDSASDDFLLALVAQRAAGRPLARFAAERIFAPAALAHTRVREDHTALVPGRAVAYAREGTRWRLAPSNQEHLGTGLYATVADLLKWRGGAVVLCNDAGADTRALTAELAAIWLGPPPPPPAATFTDPPLWTFVGTYRHADSGELVRFAIDDGVHFTLVTGTTRTHLRRSARDRFTAGGVEWYFQDGLVVERRPAGDAVYAAFKPLAAPVAAAAAYAGDYVSPELPGAVFHVEAAGNALRLRAKNLPAMRLTPTVPDEFAADAVPLVLRFARDRRGFWLQLGRPHPTLSDLPFGRR